MFKPRYVGQESSRTYEDKMQNGFFSTYMKGKGIEVGFKGYIDGVVPILESAIGVDLDYPGYDGTTLPFADKSQDYVYSSHCLEHIKDYKNVIQDWHRVVKKGGHIIVVVPHQFLYEKKKSLPSNWNEDHKRFYTPASLLKEVEDSLEPNSYRVRLLEDGDEDFNYDMISTSHSHGQYEITLVIQKIQKPFWDLA